MRLKLTGKVTGLCGRLAVLLCVMVAQLCLLSAAEAAPGDTFLIIANKTYEAGVPNVEFADRDADEMQKAALAKGILDIPAFGVKRYDDMTRGRASDLFRADGTPGPDLVAHVRRAAGARKTGTIYFYYTGHGIVATNDLRQTPELHLVLRDTNTSAIGATALSVDAIRLALAAVQREVLPEGHVVMLIDACFSGVGRDGAPLWAGAKLVGASAKIGITKPDRIVMLSAAEASEPAWSDPSRRYSAFTDAVLDGLYGAAADKDGKVTAGALLAFVRERIATRLTRHGRAQTPTLDGDADTPIAGLQMALLPEREPGRRQRLARQCAVKSVTTDSSEIADFLKADCLEDCPCRPELERKLASHAGCAEEAKDLDDLIGKKARVRIEALLPVLQCTDIKARAQAAIAALTPKPAIATPPPAMPTVEFKPPVPPVVPSVDVKPATPSVSDRTAVARPVPDPAPRAETSKPIPMSRGNVPYSMRRIDGAWVEPTKGRPDGDVGYFANMSGGRAACEQKCLQTEGCRMIEFFFGKRAGGEERCIMSSHRTGVTVRSKDEPVDTHVSLKWKGDVIAPAFCNDLPSFGEPSARMICANDELAVMHRLYASLYEVRRGMDVSLAAQLKARDEQDNWFRIRNQCLANDVCLRVAYEKRIRYLQGIR